jgi:hypothetical protein
VKTSSASSPRRLGVSSRCRAARCGADFGRDAGEEWRRAVFGISPENQKAHARWLRLEYFLYFQNSIFGRIIRQSFRIYFPFLSKKLPRLSLIHRLDRISATVRRSCRGSRVTNSEQFSENRVQSLIPGYISRTRISPGGALPPGRLFCQVSPPGLLPVWLCRRRGLRFRAGSLLARSRLRGGRAQGDRAVPNTTENFGFELPRKQLYCAIYAVLCTPIETKPGTRTLNRLFVKTTDRLLWPLVCPTAEYKIGVAVGIQYGDLL